MRYLLLTYYRKPTGQIDEAMTLSRKLKLRDHQMANVILDFKTLSVVKCSMDGVVVPKDWDRVVAYYYQHYATTIERLFEENGHEIKIQKSQETDTN
jgi:hypothetical protein